MGALLSFVIGVTYGVTAGHVGGRWDALMMRAVDVLYALPTLVVIILIMVYFRAGQPEQFTGLKALLYAWDDALGGMLFIFVGIGLTSWLQMARVARGETLAIKGRDYVQSALALGISNQRLMLRHILPNLLGPCIVLESATIPAYILTEAFLSFLGLGVQAPIASWGTMANDGLSAMNYYPWRLFFPVAFISGTMLAFNLVGDGLHDALDPRLRK